MSISTNQIVTKLMELQEQEERNASIIRSLAIRLRHEGFYSARRFAMENIHAIGKYPKIEAYLQSVRLVEELTYDQILIDWYKGLA